MTLRHDVFRRCVKLTSVTSSVHVTVVKTEMLLETRVALATRERHGDLFHSVYFLEYRAIFLVILQEWSPMTIVM